MALLAGLVALATCGGADDVAKIREQAEASTEEILVEISMYVLVDDLADPDTEISSRRSEEELTVILDGMNEIWGQANIRLELETLDTIEVDPAVLARVARGNIRAFSTGWAGATLPPLTGPDPA